MTDYVRDNKTKRILTMVIAVLMVFSLVAGLITAIRRIGMQKLEELQQEPNACDWRATLARGKKTSK